MASAAVAWGLRQCGVDVLLQETVSNGDLNSFSIWIRANEVRRTISPNAVWWYRPSYPIVPLNVEQSDIDFVKREWVAYHQCVVRDLLNKSAFWVNPLDNAFVSENKAYQLHIANKAQMQVLPTLISTDYKDIISFARKHKEIIFKPFTPHLWITQKSFVAASVAAAPGILDLKTFNAEIASLCPAIYQKKIDACADIRITVIGNHYFGVRIEAVHPLIRSTPGMWRQFFGSRGVKLSVYLVSSSLRKKIRTYMNAMGIVYCAFDFIEDSIGTLHFLEGNQSGQFLPCELALPELPMLAAFVAMLFASSKTFDYDSIASRISLEKFIASVDTQEISKGTKLSPEYISRE